ncbi:MAG: acyltransferase [Pseudomonadota bacterium]
MLRVLQAGRGLAAISVAAFHLSVVMSLDRYGGEAVFRDYTRHGFRGVDFFFILSGFIILFAHHRDIGVPAAWKEYAYRRFVRVFPVYWLYTAGFCMLVALGIGAHTDLPETAVDWLTSVSLVRFTNAEPPLPVAWTLFHEVAFYAVFSLLIFSKRIGIAAIVLWSIACIAFYGYPTMEARTPFNVYTAGYNLFFLLGMAGYWLYRRAGSGYLESGFGLAIFIIAAATMGLPYKLSPPLLAIGLALIVAGATKLERAGKLKVPEFLFFIGNASYSIYLAHESLQGLLLKIAIASGFHRAVGGEVTYLVVLVFAIALGCLAYLLVEKPLLALLKRYHKRSSPKRAPAIAEPVRGEAI